MAGIMDWINSIVDPRNQGQQYANENPTVGGAANNAVTGVKNFATGILGIPGAIGTAITNPQKGGQMVADLVKGTAANVNDLLGQPVATKDGQITGLQQPSPLETGHFIYHDPVGAFLTAEGVKSGVGSLKKAALPKPTEAEGLPPLKSAGNKVLQSQYRVPTNPADIEKVANYGFSNVDDVAKAAPQITQENGIITKMTRDAVANAKPVDLTGVDSVAQRLLNEGNFIPPTAAEKFWKQITDFTNTKRTNVSGTGEELVAPIIDKNPLETYHFVQQLEKKAQQYYGSSSTDPGVRELANAYNTVADEFKDRLFTTSGADQMVPGALTPENLQQLNKIDPSGNLARDVGGAKSVGELRGVAAPFVRLSQAAEKTAKKVSGEGVTPAQAIEGASTIISGNPVGVGLLAAGTNAGKTMIGNTLRKVGGVSAGLPPIAGTTLPLAAGAIESSQNNQGNNSPGGQLNQGKAPSTNVSPSAPQTIPQSIEEIKPDQNGNYGVLNPYDTGIAVSPTDYQQQYAALQAQAAEPANQVFPNKARIDAQLATLQSKKAISDTISSSYEKTIDMNTLMADARATLKNAPPNLLSLNPSYDKLRTASDGQYAKLATELQILESHVPGLSPGSLFKPQTSDVALQTLDTANKSLLNDYYAGLKNYTGNKNSQVPTGLPAPVNNQLPPMQSSDANLPPIVGNLQPSALNAQIGGTP